MRLEKIGPFVVIVLLPALFALTLPVLFRLHLFTEPQQAASIVAMILLPFAAGMLLVGSSPIGKAARASYRVFMPWVPILFFFLVTFTFQLEDCACWIIGLPLYLLFSSLGGLTAGYLRLRKTAAISRGEIGGEQ